MGYSHRWKIEEDMTVQEFKHLQGIAAKIVEASDAPVEFSTKTHPLHLCIVVEGMASDAHETFYLTPKAVEFDFCKTARKPYDEIVVGILDYADALGLLKFTSDGNPDDLAAGRKLASAHYDQDREQYEADLVEYNKAGDYVINMDYQMGQDEEIDKDEWVPNLRWAHEMPINVLLRKIEKIVFQPTIITGDSRRDLENLVALMRREVDSNESS